MKHPFFYAGIFPVKLLQEQMGIFPFGVSVCRTGAFDHGNMIFIHKTDHIRLLHIHQRPDHCHIHTIQIGYRRKTVETPLVNQGQQHGFHHMVLGYCGLYMAADEGEVINVAVAKASQGKGIASRLMDALLDEGHARGVHRFFLEVRVSNDAAIRLYEKYGFKKQGIRKHFYILPDEDAYLMNRIEEEGIC